MTGLEKKIGQMIMVGLGGEELTPVEKSIVRNHAFGGFILFSHNLRKPKQILSLCRSLWETGTEYPPLIAIDQEGGKVHRLPEPFTHFPAAGLLGRRGNAGLAYRAGKATARELALLGINLNFAPVLDVSSNLENLIIGDRSFGSEPDRVISLAGAWSRGLRKGGVIPCGKHFPGHGGTEKDSHLELPVIEKELAELRAVELPPFVHACRQGIESLMTAHVLYRALDSEFPATLSRVVIAGLLRGEIGYTGVVFGDDMEMKAISENYSPEDAVRLSVLAGVDVMLFCRNPANAVRAFEVLRSESEKDVETRTRVEESCLRISNLKKLRLGRFTGVSERELAVQLAGFRHQIIVDEIHGNL